MPLQQSIQLFQLETLLGEKRSLFDKMLQGNKEIKEIKFLFHEVRELEEKLKQQHQTPKNAL